MIKLMSALVLLGIIHIAIGQCPTGWESRDRACYYFSDRTTEIASWQNAEDSCGGRTTGQTGVTASLVKVEDSAENEYLRGKVKDMSYEYAWIGAQEQEPTDWQWVADGTYMRAQGCFDDSNDDELQQDNISTDMTASDCASICSSTNKQYSGVKLNANEDKVICKCGSIHNPSAVVTGCDDLCLKEASTEKCGGADKILITRLGGTNGGVWAHSQPNNYDDYQNCLTMDSGNSYKYADEKCHEKYSYICEYGLSQASCSGSSRQYLEGKCVSVHNSSALSWFKAQEDCQSRQGNLVKVDTDPLWNALANEQIGVKIWIGGRNRIWKWTDDTEVLFSNWVYSQPSSVGEKCAVFHQNTGSDDADRYKWEDQNCDEGFNYICKFVIPPTTTSTTTTTTTTTTPEPTTTEPTTTTTTTTAFPTSTTTTPAPSTTTKLTTTTKPTSTVDPTVASTTTTTTTNAATTTTSNVATTTVAQATTTKPASTTDKPPSSTTVDTGNGGSTTSGGNGGGSSTSDSTDGSTPQSGTTAGNTGGATDAITDDEDKLETGVIVAIIVACIAVFAGMLRLLVYCCYKGRNKKNGLMKDSPHNTLQSSSNYDNPGFMYDSSTKGSGHGDEISQDTTESETAQFAY